MYNNSTNFVLLFLNKQNKDMTKYLNHYLRLSIFFLNKNYIFYLYKNYIE